jgi:uncharacterized protein (DUF1499 family)
VKAGLRTLGLTLAFAIIAGLGLLAYIRLAPSDPSVWHVDPEVLVPGSALSANLAGGRPTTTNGPVRLRRVSFATVTFKDSDAVTIMQKLDGIAQGSERTTLVAGTPDQRHMTWVTRSKLLGFPDYTTAKAIQVDQDVQLVMVARQRFGGQDFGVNALRMENWLAMLRQ